MSAMRGIRHRRVLATIASLLWLLIEVTDAMGRSVCVYHGHAGSHGDPAAHDVAADGASHQPPSTSEAGGHDHGSAHSGAASAAHEQVVLQCAVEGTAPDDDGCDCERPCSVGADNTSAPQVTVSGVPDFAPATPQLAQPAATDVAIPLHLRPFFLPPSVAPPLS